METSDIDYGLLFGKPPEQYRCCYNCAQLDQDDVSKCCQSFGNHCREWNWDGKVGYSGECTTCKHVRCSSYIVIEPCWECSASISGVTGSKWEPQS